MYLQSNENQKGQSSVMNSVSQESNPSGQTSHFSYPPPLPTLPPPNPYYPPFHYATALNPVTMPPMYIPPYPPPNFPVNNPPSHKDNFQSQFNTSYQFTDTQDTEIKDTANVEDSDAMRKNVFHRDTWLLNFLSCVNDRSRENIVSTTVKINEAKEIFKRSIFLLKDLEELKLEMKVDCEKISDSMWNSLCCQFMNKKKNLMNLMSSLPNIEALKTALAKRQKKRKCQRKRKIENKGKIIQDMERRQQLHHQIDSWMKGMHETIENNKREVSLKKEADSVLSEVLRKKADGKRQLALVTALLKLRQLRAKSAANRGQHISIENGIKFSKVAENLKALWEKQLKEYDVEENGMRVMLSEAVDERDQSQVLKDRQVFSEWTKLLFGNSSADIPEFFDGANQSIESFIRIRQAWDKFAVYSDTSVQSSIPIGWVLPSNPSSSWEKLLI